MDALPRNVACRLLAPLQVPAGQDDLISGQDSVSPDYLMSAHLGPPLRQPPGRLLAYPRVGPGHDGHTPREVDLVMCHHAS